MKDKPTKIIYGTNIEHQENHFDIHDNTFHGGIFNLTDLGKGKSQNEEKSTDPISAKALEPYIRAGLVTDDLMPAKHLSSGEVAMLAHDIAKRLQIQKFWTYFSEKWGNNCNSSTYCKFQKNDKAAAFMKELSKL